MSDKLLKYKIGISLIPGIGSILAKKIIAYTGGIESVFMESKRSLLKIPGIGEQLANAIANQKVLDIAEEEVQFIAKNKINALFYLDKEYPERLRHCIDAPVMLYAKGDIDLNQPKVLTIVGTRNASQYGKEICNKLVYDLTDRNHKVIIVSGLAYGIDVCAHKAALKNKLQTVAVLGHGLATIYPYLHKPIARSICKQGALISDFTSKTKVEKKNFIKRNRIIAGLSDATIIIESGEKGGALITADIANSYNRDVFAIPGRVKDTYSIGCNRLIKSNKAALIESVRDLEYIMGWDAPTKKGIPRQKQLFIELSPEEKLILDLLKEEDLTIDTICLRSDLPVSKVSPMLLNLEFSGLLKSLPGKVYSLN